MKVKVVKSHEGKIVKFKQRSISQLLRATGSIERLINAVSSESGVKPPLRVSREANTEERKLVTLPKPLVHWFKLVKVVKSYEGRIVKFRQRSNSQLLRATGSIERLINAASSESRVLLQVNLEYKEEKICLKTKNSS